MIINSITLNNFGSYEGNTCFQTEIIDGKNIILIGGKNGAGKTTLFTAMRLCLYGYMSMGYKSANSFYYRSITKLINNTAKVSKPTITFVDMSLSLSNGQSYDVYHLCRKWILTESVTESFFVSKNDVELNEDEKANFEKYLLSLFPPELFNLYFFDGEKIADFFLNEGNNSRIKQAFLTLCGYDTFEIMLKNFKRISTTTGDASTALSEYVKTKEDYLAAEQSINSTKDKLDCCKNSIEICEDEISALDKAYYAGGGITVEEWNSKIELIKEEEKKREKWNALLKKWANDTIPFLMIKNELLALKTQIIDENSEEKFNNFLEIINDEEISSLLANDSISLSSVIEKARAKYSKSNDSILRLSLEQSSDLLAILNEVLNFDDTLITKCKTAIRKSIKISSKLKSELDNCNVTSAQEYMNKRMLLLEEKAKCLDEQLSLERQITEETEMLSSLSIQFNKAQSELEAELKKESINDISARSIVMIDNLQKYLYRERISKVESFFRKEINTMMRKTHFIDDIHIDDDFSVHIYKKESILGNDLFSVIHSHTKEQLVGLWGEYAVAAIQELIDLDSKPTPDLFEGRTYELPIEIDKTSLSNGEKQIFIMSLYHALISLSNNEIPFVIDTPFARIDTEHRHNIAKHFFCKLNGQVFILSTNEEINSSHVEIMKERIRATYLLENTDNKRTTVAGNVYFGEE